MLVAHQAVTQKIKSVEGSIGNTISIAPAGFSSFSQVNNSLTTTELAKVQYLSHVTNLSENITDRLTTIGSSSPSFSFGGQSSNTSNTDNQTSLTSPITINTNGSSASGPSAHVSIIGGGQLPTNFSPPITIIGTTDPTDPNGTTLTITSGKNISGTADSKVALISSAMASKNSLKAGSTFTAYGTTITVEGIFTDSTSAANDEVIVSLPTEQALSGQTGDVTSAVATVDSLDNLNSVTTAIKNTLGSSADVTSALTQANAAVQPLDSVKDVSIYSLIGAAIAGSIIILLTMVMIVRERRREIGVIKAIGASNSRVIFQFMTEAITLTIMGAIIGLGIGVVGSGPVTNLLVTNSSNNTTTASTTTGAGPVTSRSFGGSASITINRSSGGRGVGGFLTRQFGSGGKFSISDIHAVVGWNILLYSLAAILFIAIIGSTVASGLIAKIRPAEVMRTE